MISPFSVHMPDSVKEPLLKTLFSGYIGEGEKVKEFEKKISEKFNIRNCVALNSGTSALRLALSLIGVGPGDEVISTPYTALATNTAILEQYATPVFADIKHETVNINPEDIAHRITDKTKAIVCVHWGGYPCDMDEIHRIANAHGLPVVEDAAQSLGAKYKGRQIGTISPYTVFSFQAIKHITTGDGGFLSILDDDKYKEAERRKWYGIDRAKRKKTLSEDPCEDIKEPGFKYHMNNISATIGIEQLKYFDFLLKKRAKIAQRYREQLAEVSQIELLENNPNKTHANWMFAIHVKNRTRFLEYMRAKGIGATIHNWRNDKHSVFGGLRDDLPNLEKVNETLVNLPLHHNLSEKEVNYIIEVIKKWKK